MKTSERRYDIDWLRVIAIGLLLIYHVAIGFQPWGVFIGFIQSSSPLESIWVPMSMLNVWRIPLLFFVSGMGVYFAIQNRNWKGLLLERSKRILVPFLFGVVAIVPLHILLWQYFYQQDLTYAPHPGHLWFLANICVYVVIFTPLFFCLKKIQDRVMPVLQMIFKTPLGLLLLMVPFVIEVELVSPENFELYAQTMHGFWIGMIAFITGFCCVYSGESFWKLTTTWRWPLLMLAAILYGSRIVFFELKSPDYLMAVESCVWVFTVFGFARKHLNRNSKTLQYLSQAAYPVYIVHMIFIYLGSVLLFESALPVSIQLIALTLFTFAGSIGIYELLIRRIHLLRPLFGLKNNRVLQSSFPNSLALKETKAP
ncbi:MAG: acyltransferase family protein [Cyclobacteriaceae bacterium]